MSPEKGGKGRVLAARPQETRSECASSLDRPLTPALWARVEVKKTHCVSPEIWQIYALSCRPPAAIAFMSPKGGQQGTTTMTGRHS